MKITISVEALTVKLSAPPTSEIYQPLHRIFFINLLGFSLSQDKKSYQLTCLTEGGITSLLKKVFEYVKDYNIDVALDTSAEKLKLVSQQSQAQLKRAISAGKECKRKPVTSLQVPAFARQLKPYQIPAVAHLVETVNAANFSVPGSGKTSMVLAAFAILKSAKTVKNLVVIGPRAAFMPWEEEFEASFGKKPKVTRITGAKGIRKRLFREAEHSDLVLLTYQLATNDSDDLVRFLKRNSALLVLDESHNIKRFEGGKWADTLLEIAPYATRRVILSGTPAPNSIQDLWTQIKFLWPHSEILGSRDEFKFQCSQDDDDALIKVREQLSPLYWRVKKSDLSLPKVKIHPVMLNPRPVQQSIYQVIAAKVLNDLIKAPEERLMLRVWRKAKVVRLLQAASNPALLSARSEEFTIPPLDTAGIAVSKLIENYASFELPVKLDYTCKLVRKLIATKEKVLVWSSFILNLKMLEKQLKEFNPKVIYGEVPRDGQEDFSYNRERMIREFKTRADSPLLIANPAACAESVSLHRVCRHAIYVDRTFNCAQFMQSLDRIHRIGLLPTDRVHYYFLMCTNTIDEVIDERLAAKQKRMAQLLDDDLSVLDLETTTSQMSEESEEDQDFQAIVDQLRRSLPK